MVNRKAQIMQNQTLMVVIIVLLLVVIGIWFLYKAGVVDSFKNILPGFGEKKGDDLIEDIQKDPVIFSKVCIQELGKIENGLLDYGGYQYSWVDGDGLYQTTGSKSKVAVIKSSHLVINGNEIAIAPLDNALVLRSGGILYICRES